jgi:FtsH-binding integral membrane protein
MDDFNRSRGGAIPVDRADMAVDAGLRSFMLGVYNKLAIGLVVSAILAYITAEVPGVRDAMFATTGDGRLVGYTPLGLIVSLAPLAILLGAAFIAKNISARNAGIIYWSIVALIGASLGTTVLFYTGASIFSTFLITAASFGVLSLVGYTTKKNLSGLGSFLLMGVAGLLIASLVNFFLIKSDGMQMIISGIGVLVFAGLIAYDTQKLKMIYYQVGGDREQMGVATNFGALNLYLDFINLFRFLLYFMGGRR